MMRTHGNFLVRGEVPLFLTAAAVMGLGFMGSLGLRRVPNRWFWIITLGLRLGLFSMEPGDDVWRYIWEGRVQVEGRSPYALAPDAPELLFMHDAEVWPQVVHKSISAVYPPLAELGFQGLAMAGPLNSPWGFKLAILAADLAVVAVLWSRWGNLGALVYAWNPLILYGFVGGSHYDSWFLLALVLAWRWCPERRGEGAIRSALALGASVALKWVSLPLLVGLWWTQADWKNKGRTGFMVVAGVLPFGLAFLCVPGARMGDLLPGDYVDYARSAELVPWLLDGMGNLMHEKNRLYLLPFGVGCLFLWWLSCFRRLKMERWAELFFTLLLVTAPAIHAWYGTWLVPWAAATRNRATLALSLSFFVYFWLQHTRLEHGGWEQSVMEKTLMWLPFGLAWILEWKRISPPPSS
jgi:hypothetical protein